MITAGNITRNFDNMSRKELISEILSLRERLENSQRNEELYLEQIKALRNGTYGRKSETISNVVQPALFNEIEDSYQEDTSEEEIVELVTVSKKIKKKKKAEKKDRS